MKTVSAAKIAAEFNVYLEASREQPVLVTRNGKPVAVLLAVQDQAEAEHLAQSRVRSLRSILQEAHEQLQRREPAEPPEASGAADRSHRLGDGDVADLYAYLRSLGAK